MKYVFNTFTLMMNEPVFVQGPSTFYTYQNSTNTTALIEGSNDAVVWVAIGTVLPSDTFNAEHAFTYLRLLNTTEVIVRRGTTLNVGTGGNGSSVAVVNGLTSTDALAALSAAQGPVIDQRLEDLENAASGGGLIFGGEFDATPTVTTNTAEFNHLIDCAISAGTLVPSASQFGATATGISNIDVGTQMVFRVAWPDTSTGFFMFLMHNSSEINAYQAVNDTAASVFGIGASGGTPLLLLRENGVLTQDPLVGVSITVGDIVRIGYRPAISKVSFYNETQGNTLLAERTLYPAFASGATIPVNLGLFAMSAVPLAFDFADSYPLQQNTYSFTLPSQPDGKTYLVANATPNSTFDGKLLKNNDFVTFYDTASKVVVSRLLTDNQVKGIADTSANNALLDFMVSGGAVSGQTFATYNQSAVQDLMVNGDFLTNYLNPAISTVINTELEVGGSIYNAIQSAVNP